MQTIVYTIGAQTETHNKTIYTVKTNKAYIYIQPDDSFHKNMRMSVID